MYSRKYLTSIYYAIFVECIVTLQGIPRIFVYSCIHHAKHKCFLNFSLKEFLNENKLQVNLINFHHFLSNYVILNMLKRLFCEKIPWMWVFFWDYVQRLLSKNISTVAYDLYVIFSDHCQSIIRNISHM